KEIIYKYIKQESDKIKTFLESEKDLIFNKIADSNIDISESIISDRKYVIEEITTIKPLMITEVSVDYNLSEKLDRMEILFITFYVTTLIEFLGRPIWTPIMRLFNLTTYEKTEKQVGSLQSQPSQKLTNTIDVTVEAKLIEMNDGSYSDLEIINIRV
ncbi:MAG: hypothetical protein GY855_00665, partial [candidate division Zixibacteria bacterium]|nr:hypothetical protein [candidate division Zixibacteria bacterium]